MTDQNAADQPPASQDESRLRRARVPLIVAVIVAFVAIGLWLAFRSPDQLIQGMADADTINVSAKISARVLKLHVHEGDRVQRGQLMFELDSPEIAARQLQVKAALSGARALESKAKEGARKEEIQAAQANWERARAVTTLARSTQARTENLFREGVVTLQRREEIDAQLRQAIAAETAARAQLDQALAGARRQDQEAANAQVEQAQGALAEVRAASDEIEGRAPLGAEVSKRLADVGELVPSGFPVFTLTDVDRMWVSLNVREDQFNDLAIGSQLTGDIPALKRTGAKFTVYYISPQGDFATWRATRQSAGYDVKSFEIRVRPAEPIPRLRPGMSVLFEWPQR